MPMIARQSDDPLRKYWWVALVFLLFIGVGVFLPMMNGSDEKLSGAGPGQEASEQSLESLDNALGSASAPGGPINLSMGGSGAYARKGDEGGAASSSLYQSAAAAAARPVGVAEDSQGSPSFGMGKLAGGAGTLGEALRKAAQAGAKPGEKDAKGWGGEAPRTGLSRPKANFAALGGGVAGAGGGSTGAGLVANPFGASRSNPGQVPAGGPSGAGGDSKPRIMKGQLETLNQLKGVEGLVSKAAASGGLDAAKGLGNKGFDASKNSGGAAIGGGGGLSAGGVYGRLDGVPENLKLNDPSLQKKELKPPEPPKEKPVDNSRQQMEQQLMMMVAQMAIGGILGPVFGGIGMGLAGAMGFNTSSMSVNVGGGAIPKG